jgi:hypothetical protein
MNTTAISKEGKTMVKEFKPDQLFLSFVDEIQTFQYTISSLDHIWEVLFPSGDDKWHSIRIVKYQESFVFVDIAGDVDGFIFQKPNDIKPLYGSESPQIGAWVELIDSARAWLKLVRKDWIATNKRVHQEFPLELRQGIAPHSLIRESFPDFYRLDVDLGQEKTQKIIDLVESGYLWKSEHKERQSLTANEFFNYCKIAYIAARRDDEVVDENLSGRELYRIFADGRHDGLLQIDGDSSEEFAAWIDNKHPIRSTGGHPWEIKRGGNTTHISLAVYRPLYSQNERYTIELSGESLGRMAETLRMFLAIHEAGLPIAITNPEAVRKRLLAQDNIGIIPAQVPYHRANQRFRKDQDVFEVMHYKELSRYKRRVTPFITWEPLPLLQPRARHESAKQSLTPTVEPDKTSSTQ